MNWQIGDKAIINCSGSPHNGKRITITAVGVCGCDFSGRGFVGCEVDISCISDEFPLCVFEHHELIPIPDTYNGLTISSWDKVPIEFHPKVTV